MRVPSDITITYDGNDITDAVLFSSARFEAQANAGIGTFNITIKDPNRIHEFTTGKEVVLSLDGYPYYGGYLTQKGSTFAFPAVDTTIPVTTRQFQLAGVNYNALFDRLVSRNPADYTTNIPGEPGTSKAGYLVEKLAASYLDIPSGFNTTTYVDDIGRADPDAVVFAWNTQGTTWREQMQRISTFNGAIYYIDASKNLHYHAPESVFSRWGFSDQPNRIAVTSGTGYQNATYGFREISVDEDITQIVNDVFVWGGSPFLAMANANDGTFFARRDNPTTIAQYGRWQMAEVKFGELGTQNAVNARAETIVPQGGDLPPGVDPFDGVMRNRSKPNITVKLTWFAHDVPEIGGVRDHLVPGDVVTISLHTFGGPLVLTLPLRRVSISFPALPSSTGGAPKTYARFDGDFGLSLDDPYNLWEAIINRSKQINRTINSAGSPTAEGEPGALWQGPPDEAPNGSNVNFTLSSVSSPITYVPGSTSVYVEGLRQVLGTDYDESSTTGEIVFTAPPSSGDSIWVIARLAG